MARVVGLRHFFRRDLLVVCWRHIPELIALLPPAAQWELHRLYAPSHHLTDTQVLAHIKQATQAEPSLPHRVGKHHKEIFDAFKFYADQVGKTNWEVISWLVRMELSRDNADRTRKKPMALMPIVNPDQDPAKFARMFISLAERVNWDESDKAA